MTLGAALVGLVEPFGGALVTAIGVMSILLSKLGRFLLGGILRLRGFYALSSKFLLLVRWEGHGLARGGSSRYGFPGKDFRPIRIFCRSASLVHVCTCRSRVVGHDGSDGGSCSVEMPVKGRLGAQMGFRRVLVWRSTAVVRNIVEVGFGVVLSGCGMTCRSLRTLKVDERSVADIMARWGADEVASIGGL